jgi:DNA-binding IclR family transcriptional regulator
VEKKPKDMLGKGLGLLRALGGHPAGVGVSELAECVGLPVSTTHRLLSTLVDNGFAVYDPSRHVYRMGMQIFELSHQLSAAWGQDRVREILTKLVQETGESVLMGVLDDGSLVYVDHLEGTSNPRVKGNVGGRGPLHCTAMGKMLLATMPTADQAAVVDQLELVKLAPKTIVSRDRLRRELRQIRQRGYAIADEEHERDIRAIAVPVFGGSPDHTTAAICVAAPVFRAPSALLLDWLPLLQNAAREISLVAPRYER